MKMNTDFFKTTFKAFGVQCAAYIRNTSMRVMHQLRQSTALRDTRVFLVMTYERIIVRREYTKYDLIAFFIVAALIGGSVKVAAIQTVTIGFEDYTLTLSETAYDLNVLEQRYRDTNGEATDKGIEPLRACTP